MKISRQEDYAITFMAALLKNGGDKNYVKLSLIAGQYRLPEAFLSKVAGALKKAGVIKVKEGRSGGYRLVGEANRLTLGKILGVFAPEIFTTGCADKNHAKTCLLYDNCPSRLAWRSLSKDLSRNLNQIKFQKFISA